MLTRTDAETFAADFSSIDIFLDDPQWGHGFEPLIKYWEDAKDGKPFPCWQDIDLVKVPDLIPMIQIYEVVGASQATDIKVVFQGANLSHFTREETGSFIYKDLYAREEDRNLFRDYCNFAVRWPHPFWAEGALTLQRGTRFSREQYFSLPVSSDGNRINGAFTVSHLFERASPVTAFSALDLL